MVVNAARTPSRPWSPTLEQAKGIVMAERRCSPEAAFAVLRQLSNESNVRLADVLLALVYEAQTGERA